MTSTTLQISNRAQIMKPSPTILLAAKARELKAQGKDIIDLTIGEPDFPTPQYIKEAAIAAINNNFTKYTAVEGIISLRKAICDKFSQENNLNYEPTQILVSVGAKHSLYNSFQALLNKNDEVIIPSPYWVSYPYLVLLAEGIPTIVNTTIEQNFKITPQQLAEAITPNTKAIIINSPSNPTGAVYTKEELSALTKVLLQHPKIIIISDDIYEHIFWAPAPFCNILNVCPELYERTLIINGVSKAYAMTGWRIGYTAGPRNIIAAMTNIQSQSASNAASISQVAAETALRGEQKHVTKMMLEFNRRHNFIIGELNQIAGFKAIAASGAFYLFPNVSQAMQKFNCKTDTEFADLLLDKTGVVVVPGSAFGMANHLRISYATSMSNLEEALTRIKKLMIKVNQLN